MKDLVLKGFVKSFAQARALPDDVTPEVFDAFATSVVLRKFHACDIADLNEVLTGGTSDGGIDAAAILINGRPVRSKQDLDFFSSRLRRLDVEFVFVQAKTSPEFDAGGIGTFLYGVSQFFTNAPGISFNDDLEALRNLKHDVYDLSIAMDENPRCHAYYVTTGAWNNDPEPRSRLDDGSRTLSTTNLFSAVHAVPVDAAALKSIFRELERGVTREITFTKTAVFPIIAGVDEAYLGLLPGTEYLALISNDDGTLNRDLFYDNVRDYQGNNPVNRDIAATLGSGTNARFPLLNNGITIVARSISRTGDAFRISDFQIVNGCQTTHVLHQQSAAITADTFVPVKLVVTNDSEMITEIIKATNWQTAVMPEALESLSPFHKEIEDFYNTQEASQPRAERIYYERRSKQYHFDPIPQARIVTLTAQTKSFVAMFLNEPHSHPRYYGELLKAYEHRLFVSNHKPALYFASGLAYVSIQRMLNRGVLPKRMRSYVYHLLMLLRIHLMGMALPRFNSNKATEYAVGLIGKLRNVAECRRQCEASIEEIEAALGAFPGSHSGNPPSRLKAFTELLLKAARKATGVEEETPQPIAVAGRELGTMLWFDDVKGFGFVEREGGGDVFVHVSALTDVPWTRREKGTRLEFNVRQTSKGLQAHDVRMVRESRDA